MRELPDRPWWKGDPFLAPFPRDLHGTVEELAVAHTCFKCGHAGPDVGIEGEHWEGMVCVDPTDCAHRVAEAKDCLESLPWYLTCHKCGQTDGQDMVWSAKALPYCADFDPCDRRVVDAKASLAVVKEGQA